MMPIMKRWAGAVVVASALAVAAVPLAAQTTTNKTSFAYKGTPLGSSVTDFLNGNSEFKCDPIRPASEVDCYSRSTTYAGFEVEQVHAIFLEGKLSYVEISVNKKSEQAIATYTFRMIEQALGEKYGAPTRSTGKLGNLDMTYSIWKSDRSSIQLSQSTSAATSIVGVMIARDDHWARAVDLRKSKAKSDI